MKTHLFSIIIALFIGIYACSSPKQSKNNLSEKFAKQIQKDTDSGFLREFQFILIQGKQTRDSTNFYCYSIDTSDFYFFPSDELLNPKYPNVWYRQPTSLVNFAPNTKTIGEARKRKKEPQGLCNLGLGISIHYSLNRNGDIKYIDLGYGSGYPDDPRFIFSPLFPSPHVKTQPSYIEPTISN